MINSDGLSLVTRFLGDNSQVLAASEEARDQVNSDSQAIESESGSAFETLAAKIGISTEALNGVTAALGAAATGAAITAGAIVSVGAGLFALAKRAADAGTEIGQFVTYTGLSAESVGALKVAAESAGSSLEEVEEVWESFIEILIEGGKGAEDAGEKLKKAGIDPQKGFQDLEGSVQKGIDAIRNAGSQAEKSAIAMEVFGESGLAMIKIADGMTGGFDAYKKKLVETGVIMDSEGVRKSKEFNDALGKLEKQANTIATEFAIGFMPAITNAMKEISGATTTNKSVWREWGESVGDVILRLTRGARVALAALKDLFERNFSATNTIAALQQNAEFYDNDRRQKEIQDNINDPNRAGFLKDQDSDITKPANPGNQFADAEEARKKKEEIAKKDTAALLKLWQDYLSDLYKSFDGVFKKIEEDFKKTGNAEQFRANLANIIETFKDKAFEANGQLLKLEAAQIKQAEKTKGEIASITADQQRRMDEIAAKYVDSRTAAEKTITENAKKESEKQVKTNLETLQQKLETEERTYQLLQKRLEETYAKGLISEESFQIGKSKLILDYTASWIGASGKMELSAATGILETRRKNLEEQLKVVEKNSDEEKRIKKELANVENQIQVEYHEQQKTRAESAKKSIEEQIKLEQELIELKRSLAEEERRLNDFRAEQERKSLVNTVRGTIGQARVNALIALRNFETADALRRKNDLLDELQSEENAALEKIKGKANEEDQKYQIEEAYKLKRLGLEEEFQARLKEIQNAYNPDIEKTEASSGFFGSFTAGLASYLESIALVEDANGRLQFSFEKTFQTIGQMGMEAFGQLAAGFSQFVADFVLYGDQAEMSGRKLLATILSNVAQTATSYAIMCLAAAALASTGFGSILLGGTPGQFLAAAALFGAVAVGAAVAGRAVAGDAFKRETSGAFGSSSSGSNSGQSRDDQIIEVGRNSPMGAGEMNITINDKTEWLGEALAIEIRRNGRARQEILGLIGSA